MSRIIIILFLGLIFNNKYSAYIILFVIYEMYKSLEINGQLQVSNLLSGQYQTDLFITLDDGFQSLDYSIMNDLFKSYKFLSILHSNALVSNVIKKIISHLSHYVSNAKLGYILETLYLMNNYTKKQKPTLIIMFDNSSTYTTHSFIVSNNLFFDIVSQYYPVGNQFKGKFHNDYSIKANSNILCLPKKQIKKRQGILSIPHHFDEQFKLNCYERINNVLKSNNFNDLLELSELGKYLDNYQLKRLQERLETVMKNEKILIDWLKYSPTIYGITLLIDNQNILPESVKSNVIKIYERMKVFTAAQLVDTTESYISSNGQDPFANN